MLFGLTQPRVSRLMGGKINRFGLDALVNMTAAAGVHIELRIQDAVQHKVRGEPATITPGSRIPKRVSPYTFR